MQGQTEGLVFLLETPIALKVQLTMCGINKTAAMKSDRSAKPLTLFAIQRFSIEPTYVTRKVYAALHAEHSACVVGVGSAWRSFVTVTT